ncbi:hypothetical protein K140096H11_32440 [Bacteroides intestinalis]|uniref:ATP-binding protein n=1 Tax=Bacteroides intestinalis TaxID=329854 RepID=UPI00110700EA|nr:ATP-binding protein [Bacteroides intestinalis]
MEVSAQDIIDSVDLTKSEALLPIYESVVNSIISLCKTNRKDKKIDIFIERQRTENKNLSLFDKEPDPILNVTIIDNGEGFTEENFRSFKAPFSKINKKYGCKGIGRFTILAMFKKIEVHSIYEENNSWYKRCFTFDAEKEIYNDTNDLLKEDQVAQTKVKLIECWNEELLSATAKNAEDIAKGIKEHCFIYYLSNNLPQINIIEKTDKELSESLSVESYFKLEAKDKEKSIKVRDEDFFLYILKSNKETNRKNNYVTLCGNSRTVGGKKDLSKVDSLYNYPISENGETKFLDIYVVSPYLDTHVNNSRTGFKIPESNEGMNLFGEENMPISIDEILKSIANEVAVIYESYAQETKKRSIENVKNYIKTSAPQYRSFIYRNDILESMPPNLSDEKKEEHLHRIAYNEDRKIEEKIDKFIQQKEINEEQIEHIIQSIKGRTAYNSDRLAEYIFRRKAIISLFEKMLDAKNNGKYELESMIHNLIFPMGLTNRQLNYQYHNLWLLDERFATFKFIASDKSITSFSQIKSSLEPDLVLIDNEKNLINNAISYGNQDAGEIESMVIFEFKRPGDTAHQKNKNDFRWEFSDLVENYFDQFLYGQEKDKKNYRKNIIKITPDTPKFGYIIMDEMPDKLIDFNIHKGWRRTPFGSYYKINGDLNLHIEAITFQNLLMNVKKKHNSFFDHLFAQN